MSLTLRPAAANDETGIVAIHNLQEPGSPHLTIERNRAERAEQSAEDRGEQFVAVIGDQVVGYGGFHGAWWTGDPSIYSIEIRVHSKHCRLGIGTRLYELIRT